MIVARLCVMKGISVIRTVGQLRIVKGILGKTGVILHFAMDLVYFRRMRTIRSRRLCSVTSCFQPPMLPVSLQLKDIGPLPLRPTVVSASLAAPPWEDGLPISGVGPMGIALPELKCCTTG